MDSELSSPGLRTLQGIMRTPCDNMTFKNENFNLSVFRMNRICINLGQPVKLSIEIHTVFQLHYTFILFIFCSSGPLTMNLILLSLTLVVVQSRLWEYERLTLNDTLLGNIFSQFHTSTLLFCSRRYFVHAIRINVTGNEGVKLSMLENQDLLSLFS